MRDDFAVFITSHKRPNKQKTLDWLKKHRYSGKWYLVIDDMDETKEEYLQIYWDHVLVFDKEKQWKRTDTLNNTKHLAAVIFARQFVEEKAVEMGLKSFMVADDDISGFCARMPKGEKMARSKNVDADRMMDAFNNFLLGAGGVASISPGTQNLYMEGAKAINKFPRKASNAFFRNTAIKVDWKSAMNEDIITCVEYNRRGILMCTAMPICAETAKAGTGQAVGGMRATYDVMSDFERGFYAVIEDPSRCYLKMTKSKKGGYQFRIARDWKDGDPMILNERWRK